MVAGFSCALSLSGCILFQGAQTLAQVSRESVLPDIKTPADAIRLDIMFVERPINDPLLSRGLWEEMDQMIDIPADRRMELHENGFKFGLAGTEAPPTLAALLEEGAAEEFDELNGFWTNRRLSLRRGQSTVVMCDHDASLWKLTLSADGRTTPENYDHARGVMKVELREINDGWVRVHVQPEVHHGAGSVRHEANENGWSLSSGQAIDTIVPGGFDVSLNLNEMFVMSADDSARDRAGNYFFRREDDGRLMQRVVVFRVADLTRFDVARQ